MKIVIKDIFLDIPKKLHDPHNGASFSPHGKN